MRVAKITLVAATAILPLLAQTRAEFEVASVKVNHSGSGSSNLPRMKNGRLMAENTTLMQILQVAYGLSPAQISGPAWLESNRFDLSGKAAQDAADSELMPLLQALLKDRFALAVHRESREMPAYDLVVAKGGAKVPLFDPAHMPPTPPRNGAQSMMIGVMTMAQLANNLARPAGRPVVDKTGLEGRYFCALLYSPLAVQTDASAADGGPLDIFEAVQEQLGLKLEPRKEPIDILVVDHAERTPREN